jgi:F0F1-type ATP synthase assembly protein I
MPQDPKDRNADTAWVKLSGLGVELAAAVGGLSLAGYWWDRHFGTSPWGLLTGLSLGMVGGMYNLIRQALAANRKASSGTRTTKRDDPP